jgi:hypothetical protein
MNARGSTKTTAVLKWVLGLVVLGESLRLALAQEGHFIATHPLLHHLRPALGWSEAVAAALFLIPLTTIAGGYALLVIFAMAAVLHVLHGEIDIGMLLVYGAAVLVVLTNHRKET